MKKSQIKNYIFLFLAATIWGIAFVAQSDAADHIGPFAFNALRSFIATAMLFSLIRLWHCPILGNATLQNQLLKNQILLKL